MRWGNVTETQDEREWFEDYVRLALSCPAPARPPVAQHIGATTVTWFETESGTALITATGGSPDDRILGTTVVREQLRGHGIHQAQFSFDWDKHDPLRKESNWDDIMAKAKRLIQSGQVHILRNSYNNIVASVQGDHGTYQSEIGRDDPNSRAITTWQCDCPWDQFAWQRTREWKKYEGRPCAHVLAAYWKALSTPLDEDAHPGNQPPNQPTLFDMQPQQGPGKPSPFAAPAPGPPQGQQLPIPGMPPQDSGVIPPDPYDPANMVPQVNPASVPGLKQPSPTNPVQYPGGTFSSWDFPGGWEFDKLSAMDLEWPGLREGTKQHEYYAHGGCGKFALAFAQAYPHLRVAADWFKPINQMSPRSVLAHAVAYDPATGTAYDARGTHPSVTDALVAHGNPGGDLEHEADPDDLIRKLQITQDEIGRAEGAFTNLDPPAPPERMAAIPTGFQNGAIVSTKDEDWGVWVGRSEEHGAGQPVKIPRNAQGEVLGQDPTGMVNVLFMGPALTADKGRMEPYGATAWYFPSQLTPRPDVKPPGPAIRRRK